MTTENITWQTEIRRKYGPDADTAIQMIEDLLQDETSAVLSQFASYLVINLRDLRYLAQTLDQDCDPAVKETVLYQRPSEAGEDTVTLNSFNQQLQKCIAESKETVDLFALYAMAVAERDKR